MAQFVRNRCHGPGTDEVTLVLRYQDTETVIVITEANRELLAYGGWHGWRTFVEEQVKQRGAPNS